MDLARGARWLGVLVVLSMPATAFGQQGDRDLEARTHFAAGEYQKAAEIYASLYAETLHPTYLRNIARCYQNMGEPDRAISSFKEYLRKATGLDAKQRDEINGFIKEMEDLKKSREPVAAAPPPAAAPRLEAPPPTAPPPTAKEGAAGATLTSRRDTSGGASEAKDDGAFYGRWWFWAIVGVVAAGGAATAVVLSRDPATPTYGTTLGTMRAQ